MLFKRRRMYNCRPILTFEQLEERIVLDATAAVENPENQENYDQQQDQQQETGQSGGESGADSADRQSSDDAGADKEGLNDVGAAYVFDLSVYYTNNNPTDIT